MVWVLSIGGCVVTDKKAQPLTLAEILAKHGVHVVETSKGLRFAPGKGGQAPHFPLHKRPKGG